MRTPPTLFYTVPGVPFYWYFFPCKFISNMNDVNRRFLLKITNAFIDILVINYQSYSKNVLYFV